MGRVSPLKASIFDLDGTLVVSPISFKKMRSLVIRYLESIGVSPGILNTGMLNFEITKVATDHLRTKGFSEEQIREALGRVTEIMNQIELESLNGATLIEGVPEILKALRGQGLKLGVMTRSCREYAEKVLARFGLRGFFDAVVARDDVENPKPDPEHALALLRELGVPPEEAVFVGDHWLDAECARKAGLKFILVKRNGHDAYASKESDYPVVSRIKDIYGHIESCE